MSTIINGIRQVGGAASGSAGNWGPIVARTLVAGVLAVAGARNIAVTSQTGATDDMTSMTGIVIGQDYQIQPTSGDTITVKDGASLNLGGVDFTMNNVDDVMVLHAISATVLKAKSYANND